MNRHIINSHSTVIQALRQLNELSGGVMTLVVTDDNDKMLGTLTDGDIRRGLLNGITPDDPLSAVTHTAFHYLRADATPRRRVEAMRHARRKNLKLLPEPSLVLSTSRAPIQSSRYRQYSWPEGKGNGYAL